jgi:hypothetical protein
VVKFGRDKPYAVFISPVRYMVPLP